MYIQTVCGKIKPEALGVTLMHEHILWNDPPDPDSLAPFRHNRDFDFLFNPVALSNRTELIYYAHMSADNMVQTDHDLASDELSMFLKAGGASVADVSSAGLYRNPEALKTISQKNGVNIIMSTGLYCESRHPPEFRTMTVHQTAECFIGELTDGVADTGIKCGVIGEMGISNFGEGEKAAMKAAGIAQRETGAAVTTHIDFYENGVWEALDILEETGCDLSKVILGHTDRWWDKTDLLRRFLDRGITVEFDTFGTDFVLGHSICYPNDSARISGIRSLIDEGYLDQIVLGHDTFSKMQLYRFGGGGYAHILRHVLPVMKNKHFSDYETEALLIRNPARLLTIDR